MGYSKPTLGQRVICKNPSVLEGFYDSVYKDEIILTVTHVKVPKPIRRSGSYFYTILCGGLKTKLGHDLKFSVDHNNMTSANFTIINN